MATVSLPASQLTTPSISANNITSLRSVISAEDPPKILQSSTKTLEHRSEAEMMEEEEEEEYETEEWEEEAEFTDTEAENEMENEPSSHEVEEEMVEEEEIEAEEEEPKKVQVVFMCHEVEGIKHQQQFRSVLQMSASTRTQKGHKRQKGEKGQKGDFGGMDDDTSEDDDKKLKAKKYQRLFPDELEYRPAAMAPAPTIIRQITTEVHNELHRLGCQRVVTDKHKIRQDAPGGGRHVDDDAIKAPREGMDKKLDRLKIYRRALGSLVIYFRAYSPILCNIKKSYDDMLTYRLRQFKEAQHEKLRLYQEKVSMQVKMANYRFPDYKKLHKARLFLTLLLTRISKQDEAIKFITEILSKMERCLSDHYEQERDLEDQIKLLDIEIADRRERALFPMKRYELESEDNKEVTTEVNNAESVISDSEEEPIDETEEMDEDKRMVLILAYAVCLKDFEEAEKKLKVYETKYQNVSPRHELESMRRKIIEEKSQIKFLLDERDAFEQELRDLKGQNDSVNEELDDLREMPEDLRLDAIKKKFTVNKGSGTKRTSMDLDESLDDLADNEDEY